MKKIITSILFLLTLNVKAQQIVSLGNDALSKVQSQKSREWVSIEKNAAVYVLQLGAGSSSNAPNYPTVVLRSLLKMVSVKAHSLEIEVFVRTITLLRIVLKKNTSL